MLSEKKFLGYAGIRGNILQRPGEEIICDTNWKVDQWAVGICVCSADNNARDTQSCIRLSCYRMYNRIFSRVIFLSLMILSIIVNAQRHSTERDIVVIYPTAWVEFL